MLKLWSSADKKIFNQIVTPLIKGQDVEAARIELGDKLPDLKSGDVCLGFGTKALNVLQKAGLCAKNKGLGSYRETPIKVNGGKSTYLLTYDPSIVNNDYARKPEIEWDTRLAMRLKMTGSLEPKIGEYKYVTDFTDAILFTTGQFKKTGKPVPVSCDLETIGLYPYLPDVRIVSLSVTYKPGQADVMYFPTTDKLSLVIAAQIRALMQHPEIITRWANGKFDKGWMLERWGIECTNDKFDSLLVGSLLDENRSNNLNLHAKIFTSLGGYDDPLNAKWDKSRMDLVPKDELLPYAGGDTDACYRTSTILRRELIKDKRLTNFYVRLVQPASQVFTKVEHRGMVVDRKRYEELEVEVGKALGDLEQQAFSMIPVRTKLRYSDNLSLTRDVILREFLFTTRGLNLKPKMFTPKPDKDGKKRPSCSIDHLEMFSNVPEAVEFLNVMRQYNSAKKTLSTYIVGFMKHLRSDGKFHPSYILHRGDHDGDDAGTVTGRTSAKDPAIQTIPKHTIWTKALRSVYVPPPGYVILNADYSQGELRVAACVADEPTMIQSYKDGIDLHSVTAAELNGLSFEDFMKLEAGMQAELRQGGKAGNFGLLYGMMPKGFVDYAYKTFNVKLTEAQAIKFRKAFFKLYSGLQDYHDDTKAFAAMNGHVRSPLGRVRHLPLINTYNNEVRSKQERQAINSPIQSTLSDLTMLAMVELDRKYPDLWIFLMTHDNIAMYVKEDEFDMWAKRVTETMENLPLHKFGWKPQLPFVADIEIGAQNLADLQKYAKAA